jgi:hypothetical protein
MLLVALIAGPKLLRVSVAWRVSVVFVSRDRPGRMDLHPSDVRSRTYWPATVTYVPIAGVITSALVHVHSRTSPCRTTLSSQGLDSDHFSWHCALGSLQG